MAKETIIRLAPSGQPTAVTHQPNMRMDANPISTLRLTVSDSTGMDILFSNRAGPQYGVGHPRR